MRQTLDQARADGIGNLHEYDRQGVGGLQQRLERRAARRQNDRGCEVHQVGGIPAVEIGVAGAPPIFDLHIVADRQSQFL